MNKILVTIGARGGSKGVKGKNIRKIKDKPLIVYTIEQALAWDKATRVIVSTDCKDIAAVAKAAGAEVPFMRPEALASDTAKKTDAIKHALIASEQAFAEEYDMVVDLDVTAPIRTVKDLDNCLELFLEKKPKTLFSVVSAHKNPYFNMVELSAEGKVQICKTKEGGFYRRQDSPNVYSLNASIYFYDRNYVLNEEDPVPISDDIAIYEMDDMSGVDIDREIDFKFIEFLVNEEMIKL